MAKITKPTSNVNPVTQAIYDGKEAAADRSPRHHLGASAIGRPCDRELWLSFRWCFVWKPDGRMLRLLETGHNQEARIVADLRLAGMEVEDVDEDGNQFRYAEPSAGGHFSGSLDGKVLRVPRAPKTKHLLEVKTAKASIWKAIVKNGVAEEKPEHYAQMQVYMKWSGLRRALYLAVNKDTDEIYAERVRYDAAAARGFVERGLRIVDAVVPPDRISDDPGWYQCKTCAAWPLCHGGKVPPPACRNCVHATPVREGEEAGEWNCALWDGGILAEPCERHIFVPGLLPGLDLIGAVGDDDADGIAYHDKQMRVVVNGVSAGASVKDCAAVLSSQEIHDKIEAGDDLV